MIEINGYEIISLAICFILSGLFSGSEAVLLSLGIDRAKQIIEKGGARGKTMQFMVERPSELLTTILVGNNVVNIYAASMTTSLATRYFQSDAVGISTGITTLVILIFGEVMPKTFARTHAENLSVPTIRMLQFWYYLLYPVIRAMVWVIHTVLGENAQLSGRIVTKSDVEYMVQKAEAQNSMDSKQLDLLNSILEFPKIKVKDIMIPRKEINFLQASADFDTVIAEVKTHTHSRYPVCDGELENMKGFLHAKDLAFVTEEEKREFNLVSLLKSPFFVYEHMKIQAVFDYMNRKKVHLALVKDETGLVVGIVTLEDIVEEIMGEIQDEHDDEEEYVLNEYKENDLEMGIVVEGPTLLRELYNDYDIKIPLNDNYSTLAGFVLDMLGNNFPEEGQIIVWEGLIFELLDVDDYEIRSVRIKDADGEKHYFSKKEVNESEQKSNGAQTSEVEV